MDYLNVEVKACYTHLDAVRQMLLEQGAHHVGTDQQLDTYFVVNHGRLKLREDKQGSRLIQYARINSEGPKDADIQISQAKDPAMREVLAAALGILVIVQKKREVYAVENVVFHLDYVEGLGNFFEIEARDSGRRLGRERLEEQCHYYMALLGILDNQLVAGSYSDLLLERNNINFENKSEVFVGSRSNSRHACL